MRYDPTYFEDGIMMLMFEAMYLNSEYLIDGLEKCEVDIRIDFSFEILEEE